MSTINIDEGNPLLERIHERDSAEWYRDLHRDPRMRWTRPFGRVPESYTEEIENLMVATPNAVQVASALSTRLISGLRRRDPRLEANRRRLYKLADLSKQDLGKELKNMPWFADGASGAILRGPTGCSKSHSLTAFVDSFPRWLEHGPNEECGWTHLQQLVSLRVWMPSDFSRSGLLHGIVAQIDAELGTQYMPVMERKKTIEKQLIYVLQLLTIHRCGVLIIEEAQERNFKSEVWGTEFVTVFLRIMNCGVPLVLVGNPLAFDHVLEFSQDLRRLTKGGLYDFMPVFDDLEPEWAKDLVPGVWGWTVFDTPDRYKPDSKLLFERTGGIHGVLATYRKETLVTALRAQADTVEQVHFDAAWYSPVMRPLHSLVRGYATKCAKTLGESPDQPIAYLEERWAETRMIRAAMAAASASRSA